MAAISSNTAFPTASSTSTNKTNTGGTITDKDGLDQTFSNFLTLLTTQLQHQDPTAPMDTAQFTNQLVSFSQVEQQLKTNSNLDKLVKSALNNQTQLGLSYIGLDVSMKGNQFTYNKDTISQVGISYNLEDTAASTTVNILDSKGNIVYSEKGLTAKGDHTFVWDGKKTDGTTAAAGTYTVMVGALDAKKLPVSVTTQVPGRVTGMQTDTDGSTMLVIDQIRAIPLANITSAWVPISSSASNDDTSNNTDTGNTDTSNNDTNNDDNTTSES